MSRDRWQLRRFALSGLVLIGGCIGARTYEQTYLRASDNWKFRARYPEADHLFNGFDYGHAILSEMLIRHPDDAPKRLEGPVYQRITCDILRDPPSVPLEERAVGPTYTSNYPEAVATFEWAHMLHRQVYDIIAAYPLATEERERRMRAALRYYRSRPDLALSAQPKTMELMEGQPYSLTFRRAAPKFNGLIWSYHWLQMVLYDALLDAPDPTTRKEQVARDVELFRRMTYEDGKYAPAEMPMSPAIAPTFTKHYPEFAAIFDNLHSLHDVVSDVLASPSVKEGDKRAAILLAISRYRDSTSYAMSREEWIGMSGEMGGVDTLRLISAVSRCR
ncbi:MAG TPA: hypothetical protein VF461_15970 [Gemmatimonadaceae bacterium]